MRKTMYLVTAILMMLIVACGSGSGKDSGAQKETVKENVAATDKTEGKKVLVAYFSRTGTTEQAAKTLSEVLNADIFKIEAAMPYTDADVDNENENARARKEQNDEKARPEIKGKVENFEQYDIIFVGYPIWWGNSPKIMSTFVESYDFKGKTVIPFITSGNTEITDSDLKPLVNGAEWKQAKRFSAESAKEEFENWVKELNLK